MINDSDPIDSDPIDSIDSIDYWLLILVTGIGRIIISSSTVVARSFIWVI